MKKEKVFFQNIGFIVLSGIGGYILSLTGISIGWMIGSLIMSGFLSFWQPAWLRMNKNQNGIQKYWLFIGQWTLGIELGQRINTAVLHTFREHWMTIIIMLFVSILLSLLSGFALWRFSQTDMLTSFIGTAPGGLSAMPGIAQEAGANTAVVSLTQTIRVLLVTGTIPIFVSYWNTNNMGHEHGTSTIHPSFEIHSLLWTGVLVIVASVGYFIGKHLKFPSPWLLGSMLGVALIQTIVGSYKEHDMIAWWPHWLIILSQILMGSSIGSRLNKKMFIGVKRMLVVSLLGSLALTISMFLCAFFVSKLTGIAWNTSVLAFAPGGIAEMATTAAVLHADSTFVVAVQVLRVLLVIMMLPPFFRLLDRRISENVISINKEKSM
ncbi:AbrB family transcriptional regulator [Ectobacillus panaciterrae]|uniref:AbrB family transcriptional regulator n=1 Tax=Ectobacillus panaciterrae TaxID=363872 RepID=UPI0004006878|nr:AbrB family transcriptional regulator [Ectobacillus panaciterrae]